MYRTGDNIELEYNTEREKLRMPEYGRNVLKMVEDVLAIEDREQRSRQAMGIVKVMELLNPQVHQEENWEQKLWDHLHIISGFKLDVDSPYPMPKIEEMEVKPMPIPLKGRQVKATHYGRNIESIIDLIASQEDGDQKTAMIRSLAIYMRQQYLIWNKDSVADETIFNDIEKLSDYRIKVPEGISLTRIASDANFARPGMNIEVGGRTNGGNRRQGGNKKNFRGKNHQKGR
ncbi:MAG: DUF4290 domain-containing protein [Bacteroidales bacterium]|nr:DUF4290 domain-containing protein [Bacteroidales bacterium]